MRGCGMEYFSTIKLSWNKIYRFPYRTFWWAGVDGTRVLVHMPPEGDYNSAAGPHNLLRGLERYPERAPNSALLVFGSGDGGGGPRESHLELLKRERNLSGLPRVRYSSAIDFFDALRQKRIDHVWRGELYLDVHQGTYNDAERNKAAQSPHGATAARGGGAGGLARGCDGRPTRRAGRNLEGSAALSVSRYPARLVDRASVPRVAREI